jgi:hypothetical protein
MSGEDQDQITWVALNLNFSDHVAARLEKLAQAEGLSLKCLCVHRLHKHLMGDATMAQREKRQRDFPAELRRNGCNERPRESKLITT